MDTSYFREIPGYEGLYWINKEGTIKSKTGRVRKHIINTETGYPGVMLSKLGKVQGHTIHRLVALTFIPNPMELSEVAHIDNNRRNCNYNNLRWDTRKGNAQDMYKFDTIMRGAKHYNAKLSEFQVRKIRDLYSSGKHNQAALSKKYKIGPDQISRIVNNKSWKHVGGVL